MKKYILLAILTLILISGCAKDEPEPLPITAEVIKEPEPQEPIKPEPAEEPAEEINIQPICADTDNGAVRWKKGKVTGYNQKAERFEKEDYCFDQSSVIEYYCINETLQETIITCKSGCKDAACI